MVSLCTSMPTNRVGCSMSRLLCLRLHARPSGATLDHRHTAMTAHPFRLDTDMRSSGSTHSAEDPVVGLVLPTLRPGWGIPGSGTEIRASARQHGHREHFSGHAAVDAQGVQQVEQLYGYD